MKKLTSLIATLLLIATAAIAGPAKPGYFKHTQKDGTIIMLQRFGDEFHHFTLSEGKYAVKQGADGDYYFAAMQNGLFVASDVRVAPVSTLGQKEKAVAMKSINARPIVNPNTNSSINEMIRQRAAELVAQEDGTLPEYLSLGIWGNDRRMHMNALVVLVEYQDVKFTTPDANQAFYNLLNQEGYDLNGATGSAKDYFEDNSCGQFTIDIDVAGPYTLAQKMSFYGGNDPNTEQDSLPHFMVAEGCKLAQDAGDITDFTKYDNDKNGDIDMVFIIYAGYNEAEGAEDDTVWPHKSTVGLIPSSYQTVYNGKRLGVYACTSELSGYGSDDKESRMSGIGSFCHEFSHVLGLPDLYDTDYGTPSAFGLSYASIMDHGNYFNYGCTPPAYNILERWLLGWAQPTIINKSGKYEVAPVYTNAGYLLWANDEKNEFFLFENRSKEGNKDFKWDNYLLYGDRIRGVAGGEGMMVLHVDCSNPTIWKSNKLNANPQHEYVRFVRANMSASDANSDEWFFPGGANITELTDKSVPALANWAGSRLRFNIENIALDGDKITFDATEVIFTKEIGQYDALIGWANSEHVSTYSTWQVKYTDNNGNSEVFDISEPIIHLNGLTPSTDYILEICGMNAGAASDVLHTLAFTTEPNVRNPMSSLGIEATYNASDLIKLSVQNLEYTPEEITWFIDGKKSNKTYLSLSKGKHQVCALITDTEGNSHYLYRYITVK